MDDVADHQELEPQQDGTSDPLPVTTVVLSTRPALQSLADRPLLLGRAAVYVIRVLIALLGAVVEQRP